MAENSNMSVTPIDISMRKSSHWSTTCNYCNEFWYKGSPAILEDHLDNSYVLSGRYLAQETAFVNQAINKQLTDSKNLTIENTLKTLAEENLIEGGGLKHWIHNNNSDIVNTLVQAILHTRAFFDNLKALAFAQETFRCIILATDNFYEKLGKTQKERKMLMSQLRKKQPTSKEVQDNEFLEEKTLKIKELLNIDVADFTNDLGEIVFTANFESSEEEDSNIQNNDFKSNVNKGNWDPEKEAKSMLD
ncbi:13613_t:CDS:2 [Dentiscutata heterogama]|uniref:13613_t:CDS:1 n=1 Tax=Dentiscutata heterogama TaxID=1316150 RepID=A0ACA9LSQ7_9GLOM|nr:13613_t:CDS:2 [Dentiscutata heterogama]